MMARNLLSFHLPLINLTSPTNFFQHYVINLLPQLRLSSTMQTFKQTFVAGAFDAADRDEILKAIDNIERVEAKIAKKRGQKSHTKQEEKELKDTQQTFLDVAIEPARRPQPEPPKDYGKAKIGTESQKAIRALFKYIESHLGTSSSVSEAELRAKIDTLTAAVRMDGVDYESVKVEKTPALSFEQPGVEMAPVDEGCKCSNTEYFARRGLD
jgi:hypothetical protein